MWRNDERFASVVLTIVMTYSFNDAKPASTTLFKQLVYHNKVAKRKRPQLCNSGLSDQLAVSIHFANCRLHKAEH